jgi:hypothetical protein
MSRRLYLAPVLAAFLTSFAALPVRAQEPPPATVPDADVTQNDGPPAHVSYVEGNVTLDRDGRPETGVLNMPLESGDRLRTNDGRVEVLFGDGSALYADARSTIDVQSDDLLRLIDGRLRIAIVGPSRAVAYRIDSPAGSVNITQPGDYRLTLLHGERETQLELAVLRGAADIFTPDGTTPVRAGQRAYASAGLAPSLTYAFNSATWDDFDRWTEGRRGTQLSASAQYLPEEAQSYAPVLDAEGDWRYQQTYGYVWYPRVAATWRPYYYGRWVSYPRYGWTWVGIDHFGWPTHHYGRWGNSGAGWFWIPGRHWAPAYVSWAYAPGYVSWCPLGFDNRAVFALNVSVGHSYYSSRYSPWNYWTVVAAPHFGYGYVNQRVIHVDRVFAAQSRPVFVSRPTAPAYRGIAVARGAEPIRWAGARSDASSRGTAVPRAGVPNGRDNYFTRDSNRADHAVQRGSTGSVPVPSQPARENNAGRAAPPRSSTGQSTVAPRAVPRNGGGTLPMYQSRSSNQGPSSSQPGPSPYQGRPASPDYRSRTNPGVTPQRTAPPAGYAIPRGGREGRGTTRMNADQVLNQTSRAYGAPSSPAMTTIPRRAQPPSPAPSVREVMPRTRPQTSYAPAPREVQRPERMAVPRQAPVAPRSYESMRVERRSPPAAAPIAPPQPQRSAAPAPQRSAAPAPQPSAAPAPRAVPRQETAAPRGSGGGRSAPPPRGGRHQ